MPSGRGRNDRNGSRRRKLRARLRAMGLPCALCGAPIDYSLPARHPLSFEVDEIIPVSLGGSELEWANLQPAHRICNERKGNKVGFTCAPPTVRVSAALGECLRAAPGSDEVHSLANGIIGDLSQDWSR